MRILQLFRIGLFLLGLFALLPGGDRAFAWQKPPSETARHTMQIGDLTRSYWIYQPTAQTKPESGFPAVIMLHGGGSRAEKFELTTFGKFEKLAKRDHVVLVFPQGNGKQWNDGRNVQSIPAQRDHIDDVGFLSAMIDDLVTRHGVNPHRVFMGGISNGGFMTSRMACEAASKLSGIAIVAASIPESIFPRCSPGKELPAIIFHGTSDPMVHYEGGTVTLIGIGRGKGIPVEDMARFWQQNNRTHFVSEKQIDQKLEDGTSVLYTHTESSSGIPVDFYKITGGGHTWPNGLQYAPVKIVGRTSREIDATELIWKFFMSR